MIESVVAAITDQIAYFLRLLSQSGLSPDEVRESIDKLMNQAEDDWAAWRKEQSEHWRIVRGDE